MATKTVVISDLSGEVVADEQHVSVVVRDHPALDGAVRLDAAQSEIKSLAGTKSDFVVVELHTQNGTENMVVELSKFDGLFKLDSQEALESAERFTDSPAPRRGRPRGSGTAARTGAQKAKRDPEQLNAIRQWARANGWPDLGDRGRIPMAAEEAYNAATG